MDKHRDRSVMDRGRDREQGRHEMNEYPRSRYEGREWESFDREGRDRDWDRDRYGRSGGYGQGSAGGYNEQHTADYRSDETGEERWRAGRDLSDSRRGTSDWNPEDRGGRGGWSGAPQGRGSWGASPQYDRGGWGSSNPSQVRGGGTHSSGVGYGTGDDRGAWEPADPNRMYGGAPYGGGAGYDRGQGRQDWNRGYGSQTHTGTFGGYTSVDREHDRERERDWNEDTRDRERGGGGGGVMESIGRFFGFGPKNYRRSDERMTEEVNDRLYRHPEIDASDVDVSVKDGEVTLSGTVDSRRAKYMAEDLCDQVMGVKDVNNQLRVRKPAGSFASDPTREMASTSNTLLGSGATSTLGQSQTGLTRDVGEPSKTKNR